MQKAHSLVESGLGGNVSFRERGTRPPSRLADFATLSGFKRLPGDLRVYLSVTIVAARSGP